MSKVFDPNDHEFTPWGNLLFFRQWLQLYNGDHGEIDFICLYRPILLKRSDLDPVKGLNLCLQTTMYHYGTNNNFHSFVGFTLGGFTAGTPINQMVIGRAKIKPLPGSPLPHPPDYEFDIYVTDVTVPFNQDEGPLIHKSVRLSPCGRKYYNNNNELVDVTMKNRQTVFISEEIIQRYRPNTAVSMITNFLRLEIRLQGMGTFTQNVQAALATRLW